MNPFLFANWRRIALYANVLAWLAVAAFAIWMLTQVPSAHTVIPPHGTPRAVFTHPVYPR